MKRRFARLSQRLAVMTASAILLICSSACAQRDEAPVEGDEHRSGPPAVLAPERIAALESSLRSIEADLAQAPRDRWDPDFVVQQVGTDPQRLFDWVQENTWWIPYRGLLRGPAGVLNDRLGNSLDRAVLLATLLQKAGHTVRLAHRELGAEEGFELAFAAASAPYPEVDVEIESETAEVALSGRAQTLEAVIADLDARVADQTQRLLNVFDESAARNEWLSRFEAAVAAVRDHWWVQRQDGETWVDFDVLASPERPAGTPSATFSLTELASQHHELAVRVIAEQWSAGRTRERKMLEHIWRPAETMGQPIVLQFWPADWRSEELVAASDWQQALRAMALEQELWGVALTIGEDTVANTILTASGDQLKPQRGGPFGAIAGSFEAAQSGSAAESSQTLTAVWIEYEIRSPAGAPRHIRRQVFDLLGPAARAAGATTFNLDQSARLMRSLSLTMRTEILPVNAALSAEYVAHLGSRQLLANQNLILAAVRGELAPGTEQTEQLLKDSKPELSRLYALALARMEWSRHADQIFIDRLNILTRHRFVASARDGLVMREATDIVANEVGVDLAARDALTIRLNQGVFDTNAERLLQIGGRPLGNTAAAFDVTLDWITLRASEDLDRLKVPRDARQRMADDLAGGYSVVAAPKPVDLGTEPFVGWWRIDTDTGDTLGIASTGWGQELAEYAFVLRIAAEIAKNFVLDSLLCQAMPIVAANAAPMVDEFFGMAGAEAPARRASPEAYKEVQSTAKGCMISAIATGAAFATLPLVMRTLKYMGRAATRAFTRPPKLPKWGPKPPRAPNPPKPRLPCAR